MNNKNLHISIPTPCHEDWNKMSPTQKGAFCKVCAKEVIDFSQMKKEEVIVYLSTSKCTTCGKINSNYLSPIVPKYNWRRTKKMNKYISINRSFSGEDIRNMGIR